MVNKVIVFVALFHILWEYIYFRQNVIFRYMNKNALHIYISRQIRSNHYGIKQHHYIIILVCYKIVLAANKILDILVLYSLYKEYNIYLWNQTKICLIIKICLLLNVYQLGTSKELLQLQGQVSVPMLKLNVSIGKQISYFLISDYIGVKFK